MQITLVRHGMPKVSPTLDPAQWLLSPEGRRGVRGLQDRLPADAGLRVASHELKAIETLQYSAAKEPDAVLRDARFNEVQRDEPFDDGPRRPAHHRLTRG